MSIFTEKESQVIYSGRMIQSGSIKLQIPIDVRNLITVNDASLEQLIQQYSLKGDTDDQTMLNIQRWVVKHIRYVSDSSSIGVPEYWQFPFETLALGIGDCEDMAILICSLGIVAGVSEDRLRVVAGWVQESPFAPQGGHGYCAYLRKEAPTQEARDQWIVLDGCYFPDPEIEVANKPMLKDSQKYKEIWFSFNCKFSWGSESLNISTRLKNHLGN